MNQTNLLGELLLLLLLLDNNKVLVKCTLDLLNHLLDSDTVDCGRGLDLAGCVIDRLLDVLDGL